MTRTPDSAALDIIAEMLSDGSEWDAETIECVAEVVKHTGRTIEDQVSYQLCSKCTDELGSDDIQAGDGLCSKCADPL